MPPKIKALLELSRVSNLPTVASNCIAAWLLAGGGFDVAIFLLFAGAALVYSGGMILNDAVDRDFDRKHRPERSIPSGVVSAAAAFVFAIAFVGLGAVLLFLAGSWWVWLAGLLAAIVAYDVAHKRWAGSVYIMGACRSLLYLSAASAGGEWTAWGVWLWGAALGVYTVAITLAARGETSDSKVGLYGILMLAAPLAAFVVAAAIQGGASVPSIVALVIWGAWVGYSIVVLKGKKEGRVGRAVSLLIAGMLLVDALAVAAAHPWVALALAASLPAVLVFQRKIAAT